MIAIVLRRSVASPANGRRRYLEYLSTLEQVVKDAAKGTKERSELHLDTRPDTTRGLTLFFVHLLCIAKLF